MSNLNPFVMPPYNVAVVLAGIYGILITATIALAVLEWRRPHKNWSELKARVRSWWWIIGLLSFAFLLGTTPAIIFLGFVAFLAFKEFLSLLPTKRAYRAVLLVAYLAIPIQFYWAVQSYYGFFVIFIPVYMLLAVPFAMLMTGTTEGFIKSASTLQWGLMLTVYNTSHLAFLFVLPLNVATPAGGGGLLVYLLFLTQFNDVAQYLWGKLAGRNKIMPSISPNKTWEGFLGGFATTIALALLLAPWLTPFDTWLALSAGALIASLGFIGDVTISALKRDLGIKDTGAMLPGHGGILDRIDSLTFAAPLFLHYTRFFFG
jgi:phosphatidate cytidylyltransferase